MRHIARKAAVRDLATNRTRYIGRPGRHGCNRLTGQSSAISGCHPTEGSAYKANASTSSHPDTAIHNSIPDITVAFEFAGKACRKAIGCCTGARCGTAALKYAAGTSCTASDTTDHPRCHQKLHTHAGTSLGYIEAHSRQITVKFLRRL